MGQSQFKNDDYIDVATRLAEFREKHPEGSLQQVNLQFIEFGGKAWVVYTAAAYRTPDDPRPGHGTAWEPVPGPTGFTRDSEVQNAETSAWGRALVAILAADTKKGIATAEEVRNRQTEKRPAPKLTAPIADPETGEVLTTKRKPPTPPTNGTSVPESGGVSEASRDAVLKSISTLTDPQQESLRELAKEAGVPNVKGPNFTEQHYKALLGLIDLVVDAA